MNGPHQLTQYNQAGQVIAPVFGSVSLYQSEPPYWLEPADFTQPADTTTLTGQPSRLLHARHRIIRFTGRVEELERLRQWRDAPHPVRVMLVHAPGGHGKTRLALELLDEAAASGWTTWQARHTDDPSADRGTLSYGLGADGGRHFVVADYADRWSHRALHKLCATAAHEPGDATRLLLMSRTLKGWWALRAELDDLGVNYDDLPLTPLGEPEGRIDLFDSAKAQFAGVFSVPVEATAPPPATIENDGYASILAVHMAALAAVPVEGETERPPEEIDEVAAFLLAREIRNWERVRSSGRDFHSGYRALTQAVFTAILTGPHPNYRDAQAALRSTGIHGDLDQLLDDHRTLYPPADDRHSLEPLYPDRLAEDFLGLLTPGHGVAFSTNPWAAVAPVDLLKREPHDVPSPHIAQTLIFLAAAASRWPHLHQTLTRVLEADPALGVLGGGAALHAIATLSGLDVTILERVAEHLPRERDLDFDSGVEAIMTAITGRKLAEADADGSPIARAYLLGELADSQMLIGDFKKTCETGAAAIAYMRPLADIDPEAHAPSLASLYSNRAQALSQLMRFDEAIESIEESERICRRLQAPDGPLSAIDLAGILSVKSALLQVVGRHDDSRCAAEECESLLGDRPAVEREHFAARANLVISRSNVLRDQKDRAGAIDLLKEGLARAESELREDDDDGFVAATALVFNLGTMEAEEGRYEDAHVHLSLAVEQYRILESENPSAFGTLRRAAESSLRGVTTALTSPENAGPGPFKGPFALRVRAEALRRSNFAVPDDGGPPLDPVLAIDLVEQATNLWQDGRRSEAMSNIDQASAVCERLSATDDALELEGLVAFVAFKRASFLLDGGEWRKAMPDARRAVELFRKLARLDEEDLPLFCAALYVLAKILERIGHGHEARAVIDELMRVKPVDLEMPD